MSFFGLRPEDKPQVHELIFELIYFSNGGFNHSDIYNMPTYLRTFYFNKMVEFKKKEKEEMDKANKKQKMPNIPRTPKR